MRKYSVLYDFAHFMRIKLVKYGSARPDGTLLEKLDAYMRINTRQRPITSTYIPLQVVRGVSAPLLRGIFRYYRKAW